MARPRSLVFGGQDDSSQDYASWYNATVDNPFHYGSAVTADRFTDRRHELRILTTCMRQGQNVILLSPRRYGKTSLLKRAAEEVSQAGGRVGMANLIQCSSRKEVAEELTTAIARGPLGRVSAGLEELRRHLAELRPNLSVEAHGIRITLMPSTPESDWTEEIKASLRILSKVHKRNQPVSLVIDEFQRSAEIDPGLPGVFKAMVDELEQVSLVFAGSRRHLMEELTLGPGAPLLGVGQRLNLEPIPREEMAPFLIERAQAGGKRLSEDVAAHIYELAHGIPNHVQQIAFWAFAETGRTIGEPAVQHALEAILRVSAVDFSESFERLAPAQQRLIRALAREPAKDPYSRRFSGQLDVANPSVTRKALQRLEEMELIELGPDGWRVANPFFERWLVAGSALDWEGSSDDAES